MSRFTPYTERHGQHDGRMNDAELIAHSRSHRQFNRQERRAGGRA